MSSSPFRQRLPAADIRIVDPRVEARIALGFALCYVVAAIATGLIERAWPLPLWGATALTSDTTYALGFKVGLLLVVPALFIRRAGYRMDDLLLGWAATPRSISTLVALFVAGLFVNARYIGPIQQAFAGFPLAEAISRVTVGGVLMLLCAAIPEELVYRWGLQTRLERTWGRVPAILMTAVLFTAWHLPSRYFLASGAEGTAGDVGSILVGTGAPVFLVGLIFGLAWDRWRNLPALIAIHWAIDTLPSVASFLKIPVVGTH